MFKAFIRYYKPHRKLLAFDLFCAFVMATSDLVFPMLSRQFINIHIPNRDMRMITILTVVVVVLYLVRMMCNYFMAYWGHVLGARMEYDMRTELFAHIQTLDFNYFDNNKTGHIMSRLINDLNEVTELAHHGVEDLFISVLMIFGSFILLYTINPILTFVVFIFVVALVFFTISNRRHMTSAFREVRKKQANINARIENSISGIRLSRAFVNEQLEIDRFDDYNQENMEARKQSFKAIGVFSSGNHFLTDVIPVMVMCFGGILVAKGEMNVGDVVAFLLFTAYFTRPVRRLIQFVELFQMGAVGFERFQEIMAIKPTIANPISPVVVDKLEGEIDIDNVTFGYDTGAGHVLQSFSLNIPKGRRIALVGPSGVGKTTLASLIPRFYDVDEGQICIDGIPIKDMALSDLRRHIGLVQQDVFIFYGSIRENILYGKPEATDEELHEAARNANIHDFVIGLPEGYDTIVGERGIKLSGGQKQRLSLARVFLKNPPILILDEATSSLDNQNEMAIQESIDRLSTNRTTIVIAHRLSTIIGADSIIVMTDDGIAERGTHSELMDKGGIYSALHHAQHKGYIPDVLETDALEEGVVD